MNHTDQWHSLPNPVIQIRLSSATRWVVWTAIINQRYLYEPERATIARAYVPGGALELNFIERYLWAFIALGSVTVRSASISAYVQRYTHTLHLFE